VAHAQLSANLREWYPEIEIKVLDCRALDMGEEQMLAAVGELKPHLVYMGDALQTTGTAAIVPRYHRAARLIKQQDAGVKICAGGFYYGANAPQILAQTPELDFIIYGETEVTLPELAKELGKEDPDIPSVKGLTYRGEGEVKATDYRPLFENLDDLPMPAYDLFPMDKYVGFTRVDHYVETYHSRGCPNGCDFCVGWTDYDPRGNKDWMHYRIRSAKRVAEELELLEKQYGTEWVVMQDEDFNVHRSRMEGLIEEMLKRGLNVKYHFMGRAPYFLRDADLLKDLRKSGLIMGLCGLEAVDEETLRWIKKRVIVDEVEEVVARFRENGICSIVTWMMGFPNDDEKAIKNRLEGLDRIDPDIAALQLMLPLPGIPASSEIEPYVEERDLSKWDFQHPVVRTKHLSREELGRLAAWANREFYSKPGRIQRVLYSDNLHPIARLAFRCYTETAEAYAKAAAEGKQFV
jgi:magnesium-protoporphyrin IX monomethyl ester (oxidative) cyclase